MSKGAEDAALKAYPDNDVVFFVEDREGKMQPISEYGREINGFIKGYEQAEKDLALTWEDIKLIIAAEGSIYDEHHGIAEKVFETYDTEEKFYAEVLRRFKEMKGVKVE